MTHHLTTPIHEQVHKAHQSLDGHYSLRQVKAKVTLADFEGTEHRKIIESRKPTNHVQASKLFVELTIEICTQCGFVERALCHHGLSYWTHRPGCSRYNPDEDKLPVGLIRVYSDKMFPTPNPDCTGCLLLCPVCKADGT
jgi:hypothetical protein